MATSKTYSFSSATVEPIILEAYECNGIQAVEIDDAKVESAIRSINFLLSGWTNNKGGLKLWTVRDYMISLVPGQINYPLPLNTIDIIGAQLRESQRLLGGTPTSSNGGTAINAFDGNSSTACTQTAPNGNISYSWTSSLNAVSLVGIQSNVTTTYTLTFEYTTDGSTWNSVYAPPAQVYTQGINVWFCIPVPIFGSAFRVRETNGATLDVQELYFNNFIQDTAMSRMNIGDYKNISNKCKPGQPSAYVVDRQIDPIVSIYLAPDIGYNNMVIRATTKIQDVNTLIQQPGIPSRYLDSIVMGLSYRLSMKSNPVDINKVLTYKNLYDEAFKIAVSEDRERTPLEIGTDNTSYGFGGS